MKRDVPFAGPPAEAFAPPAAGRPRMVFIAPNDFEQSPVNLGATSKVAALVRILSEMGFDVHYVDSSHQTPVWRPATWGGPSRVGETPVTLWRPFRLPNRKIGKVLNVLLAGRFFRRLKAVRPEFVWLYNSYAFEGAVAQRFMAEMNVPVVLEVEDLPLARYRGLNPKPHWDQRYFNELIPAASLVTFVNQGLLDAHAGKVKRSMLLPSVLRSSLAAPSDRQRFASGGLTVGYFGGLDHEKGAGTMLAALPDLPAHWRMVVTGSGELSASFAEAAQRHPGRLNFHGAVDQQQLHALMRSCDVIVNPHRSIEAMHNGVFPFKVCEAIAAGALLLSTPLPPIGEDMDRAVMFFDGSAQALLDSLSVSPAFHDMNHPAIDTLRQRVLAQYSEAAIGARLRTLLHDMLTPAAARSAPAP